MTKRPTRQRGELNSIRKPKAGRSAAATAARRKAFADAYLTNGHNATAAAIAAGFAAANAAKAGWRILRKPEVQRLVSTRAKQLAELADLNAANWAAELRAVALPIWAICSTPRESLFRWRNYLGTSRRLSLRSR